MNAAPHDTTSLLHSRRLPVGDLSITHVLAGAFTTMGRTWKALIVLMLLVIVALLAVVGVFWLVASLITPSDELVDGQSPDFSTATHLALTVVWGLLPLALSAVVAWWAVALVAVFAIDLEGGVVSPAAVLGRTRGAVRRMLMGGLIVVGVTALLYFVTGVVNDVFLNTALDATGDLVLASSITGAVSLVWWLVFLIVGAKLALTWQGVAIEGVPLRRAWTRSWHLTRGAFWWMLGCNVVIGLMCWVVSWPLQFFLAFEVYETSSSAQHFIQSNGPLLLVLALASTIGVLALTVLALAISTLTYVRQLRRQPAGVAPTERYLGTYEGVSPASDPMLRWPEQQPTPAPTPVQGPVGPAQYGEQGSASQPPASSQWMPAPPATRPPDDRWGRPASSTRD